MAQYTNYPPYGLQQPGAAPIPHAPNPPPPGYMPALQPPDWNTINATPDVLWRLVNARKPNILLPNDERFAIKTIEVPASFSGNGANVPYIATLQFPEIGFVVSANAAVRGSAIANPLDDFEVELKRTNGDAFTTRAVLGSTIFGTGVWPGWRGPSGWQFNRGESLAITVNPLANNLRIDLCFRFVSVFGPANYAWPTNPVSKAVSKD